MSAGRPPKNNASFFGHDHDMRNHRKIKAIRARFGIMGYGVWVMFLEVLTESERNRWCRNEMETELLAGDFGISVTEIRDVLDYCVSLELLYDENGFLYSKSLDEKLRPVYEKRELARDRARGQGREAGKFSSNSHGTAISATEIPQIKDKVKVKEKKSKSTNVDKEFSAYDFSLPFDSEEFREAWKMFCDHRKVIKSPLTPNSAKLVVNKLSKVEERYAKFMLEKTIVGGKYPTVYDLKDWEIERIDKQYGVARQNEQLSEQVQAERNKRFTQWNVISRSSPHMTNQPMEFHEAISIYHVKIGKWDELKSVKTDAPRRRYLNDLPELRNPLPTVFWPGELTDLPFTGEEFKAEWDKWSTMVSNKKPDTPRVSYEENLKTLGSKPGPVAIEMLKRAIKGGFNQIYFLKPEEEEILLTDSYSPTDDQDRRLKSRYDLYPQPVWIEYKERRTYMEKTRHPGGEGGAMLFPDNLSVYHEALGFVNEIKPDTPTIQPKLVW